MIPKLEVFFCTQLKFFYVFRLKFRINLHVRIRFQFITSPSLYPLPFNLVDFDPRNVNVEFLVLLVPKVLGLS